MQKAKLISYDENGRAVFETYIPLDRYIKHNVKEAYIQPIDARSLSDKQRRMCYAMLNAIAEHTGNSLNDLKEYFKLDFWTNNLNTLADKIFSLSNAPMSLVAEFQKYLIEFILEHDIPTKIPLKDYVDDIEAYVYACLINKKCCVCGRLSELHHIDSVGMGRDRDDILHLGMEAISLCRQHHTEAHTLGNKEFLNRYKFDGGIEIDKTIARIYKLKAVRK